VEYRILYEAWKKEKESSELQPLHKGFYAEASALVRAEREETQLLDERSLRAKLLAKERERTDRLLADLVETRFQKVCRMVLKGEPPSTELLATEEEGIANGLSTAKNDFDGVLKAVLIGRPLHAVGARVGERPRSVMVRFLQDIPAIVGSNARSYGPFKAEDIATLPADNAQSLIKRGVALRVEVE